jgi:pimeloyl-ACP methyl ester carboxylesterase
MSAIPATLEGEAPSMPTNHRPADPPGIPPRHVLPQWLLAATILASSLAGIMLAPAAEFLSDGVRIHYDEAGQGDPLILIHGLYSSARINWEAPGISAELARLHRVIALDNRGHGQSDKPSEEGSYGLAMVEDVTRLMDHLHIASATVVGYSMGGMIALKLASLHPDRVSAAILGGMGWLKEGSPLQRFWDAVPAPSGHGVPPACLRGFAQLALSEGELMAIHVPMAVLVGDHDPCRLLYVAPLHLARPEIPIREIQDAGHITCILKPEFTPALVADIARLAAPKP